MRFSRSLQVVGVHAEGEVGNVIVGGVGQVPGATMLDKRNHLARERDWIRTLILGEPRGQVARNANIILASNHPDADAGYVIMESIEYPVMSGSNTICVATVLLETGMLEAVEPVTRLTLESPAGLIPVECQVRDGKVTSVRFTNQPAFVHHLDAPVEVEGIGTVTVDVAWGGMAYVLLDARALGFRITPDEARDICATGERVKIAAAEQLTAVHPVNPDFPGITICALTLPPERIDGVLTAKNTVVVSPGRCDRSPCGTGTSARMALMHARGELAVGEPFVHTSIIDSRFECRIESTTTVGGVPAVVPSIAGQAWITDLTTLVLDPSDPYQNGYR
ncbi:MAG: proline racemase family protein, partial [Kineosporiaceae bacterium]|nr:proline racemase family protein [Kineosporiaceae bacterium]